MGKPLATTPATMGIPRMTIISSSSFLSCLYEYGMCACRAFAPLKYEDRCLSALWLAVLKPQHL